MMVLITLASIFFITSMHGQETHQDAYIEKLYVEAAITSGAEFNNIDRISKWLRLYGEIDHLHPYYKEATTTLGLLFYDEQIYEESAIYLDLYSKTFQKLNRDNIPLMTKLADALSKSGQYIKATEITRAIIEYYKSTGNWTGFINQNHILSSIYITHHQYRKALACNMEILEIMLQKRIDIHDLATVYNNIGYNQTQLNEFNNAINSYQKALHLIDKSNLPDLHCTILINLANAYHNTNDPEAEIKLLEQAASETACDKGQIYLMLSNIYRVRNELYMALLHAESAEKYYSNKANKENLADAYFLLADIQNRLLNHETSMEYFQKYLKIKEEVDTELRNKKEQYENLKQTIAKTEKELKLLYIEQQNNNLTISSLKLEKEKNDLHTKNLQLDADNKEKQLILLKKEKQVQEIEYNNQLLKNEQMTQALIISKQKLESEIKDKNLNALFQDKKLQQLELDKKDALLLQDKKEKEILIKDQKINKLEISKARILRQNMTIGLVLLGSLFIAIYFIYRNKKNEHKNLQVAYTDLEISEKKVRSAEQKIKELLDQQVSSDVANHLLSSSESNMAIETEACIVFIDVRNFTPTVKDMRPDEIIQFQNDMFAFMMDTVIEYKGIVNTFLGDGFMATFGAPVSTAQDTVNAFTAVQVIVNTLQQKIQNRQIQPVKIGVGMYAGNVIAGNVGSQKRRQYSVNGNPVIMASRLEQLNKLHNSTLIMSRTLFESLPNHIEFRPTFLWTEIKGLENRIEVAIFTEQNLLV